MDPQTCVRLEAGNLACNLWLYSQPHDGEWLEEWELAGESVVASFARAKNEGRFNPTKPEGQKFQASVEIVKEGKEPTPIQMNALPGELGWDEEWENLGGILRQAYLRGSGEIISSSPSDSNSEPVSSSQAA